MDAKDLFMKIAQNKNLTPRELDELGQFATEIQRNNAFLSGNITAGNKLVLDLPFIKVFDEKFTTNKTSVSFDLPSGYNHLLIYGAGSITTADGGNVWAQFNGDTGSNYKWDFIKGDDTTISGLRDTLDPYVVLGVFGTTGAGTGTNGSFVANILHYQSSDWKKSVLTNIYTSEFNQLYIAGSTWGNLTPIQTIEIFATDNTLAKGTASIAAGSIISVYALK